MKRLEETFKNESLLVVSGDALTDIDLTDFMAFHQQAGGLATLALKQVADPEQYGVVIREGQRITRFQEKPRRAEAVSNLANTGIYLFEPGIFKFIPAETFYDFGKQVFPEILAQGEQMYGYEMKGYWCDVGDLQIYREAHYDMLTGVVEVELPGKKLDGNIWLGDRKSVV